MRHAVPIVLVAFFLCSSAHGSLMVTTRDWSVAAPGGRLGFIETEFVTLSGEHASWETSAALGPAHFELPCRAPLAIVFCTIATALLGLCAVTAILRLKEHRLKHVNSA